MIKNDVNTWFSNFLVAGELPVDYFENKFKTNTMGGFKVPASTALRHQLTTQAEKNILFTRIAQIYIEAIVKLKYGKLKSIPFKWLLTEDQEQLVNVVCEAVQHAMLNANVWQRLNGSNIAVGGFTFNVDNTPWIMTSDMFGTIGWVLLTNAQIDEYEWIADPHAYIRTANGNIQIIGKTSDIDLIAELSI